ncbi:Mitochondrial inner membrane protein Mitofilin [Niveomyces insectorum RCEF 264]|uniref:MICOS complex subunit MIC60 n=1 Tax=Niveomyces insectorum RCEF 264 TaxID=1081102 RepID=A0A167VRE8_9HYPO|nr:Mitochondrial inner membrane protein Mitofilin [Niveomyces insectorum RCEF 264]
MLRTSLRSTRVSGFRRVPAIAPSASALANAAAAGAVQPWRFVGSAGQRFYADVPKPPVFPASETTTAASSSPRPPASSSPSSIPLHSVPLTPPRPSEVAEESSHAVSSPPRPPPRKGGFFRKLRNYVLTLSILGALAFGGGVWYSRINDNFHDFFTEYVPFGEQAVLYLEELDFRKRFPNIANHIGGRHHDSGDSVRVPAQSGASWRVADPENNRQTAAVSSKTDASSPSRSSSPSTSFPPSPSLSSAATPEPTRDEVKHAAATASQASSKKTTGSGSKPKTITVTSPTNSTEGAAEAAIVANTSASTADSARPATSSASGRAQPQRPPEVDEPSRWPPASPIDPLAVPDATEPVVQDVVHLLNDIITAVNADHASERYSATIGKAKQSVDQVGRKVRTIRESAEHDAARQVAAQTERFDAAARALVDRVEAAMAAQEAQWRRQVDEELAQVRASYDARLELATARERELGAAQRANALREQAVQLTRQFASDLQARVEAERGGRLGKLQSLSASVADLEALTAGWTDVVDASQRAQQLHVAIDAVKARLADDPTGGNHTPRPFVKELLAVKEMAAADPVVDAAIASIPPVAYQRGIAAPAELIDRFRRVADAVRKAALLPEDAGVASHASSYVLSKVRFKKQPGAVMPPAATEGGDANSGTADVESILTRTQALLEEGNLDGAAREMNGLSGWAKTLSRDWLGEVRKVLEVQQALDVITAEARLRSLQLEKNR